MDSHTDPPAPVYGQPPNYGSTTLLPPSAPGVPATRPRSDSDIARELQARFNQGYER